MEALHRLLENKRWSKSTNRSFHEEDHIFQQGRAPLHYASSKYLVKFFVGDGMRVDAKTAPKIIRFNSSWFFKSEIYGTKSESLGDLQSQSTNDNTILTHIVLQTFTEITLCGCFFLSIVRLFIFESTFYRCLFKDMNITFAWTVDS